MKKRMIPLAAAALTTGLIFAQTPAAPPAHSGSGEARMNRRGQFHQKMMQELNLNDSQKAQAKTIFSGAREKSQPLRTQLRADREAMRAAVKANDTAKIRSLAAKEGKTRGEISAIRSEAMAKFYATLTPEQQAKAEQLHKERVAKMRQRWEERSRSRTKE
jgi:Spy/CpxP family protein refolding chaperone